MAWWGLVTETFIAPAVSPGLMASPVASARNSRLGEDERPWVDGDVIHAARVKPDMSPTGTADGVPATGLSLTDTTPVSTMKAKPPRVW